MSTLDDHVGTKIKLANKEVRLLRKDREGYFVMFDKKKQYVTYHLTTGYYIMRGKWSYIK